MVSSIWAHASHWWFGGSEQTSKETFYKFPRRRSITWPSGGERELGTLFLNLPDLLFLELRVLFGYKLAICHGICSSKLYSPNRWQCSQILQSQIWCPQPIYWLSPEPAWYCSTAAVTVSCWRIANRQQIAMFPQPLYFYRYHWRWECSSYSISTLHHNLVFMFLKSNLLPQFPGELQITQDLSQTDKYKSVAPFHQRSSNPQSIRDTASLHDWPFVEVLSTSRTHKSFYRVRRAPYGPAHQSRHVHFHQLPVGWESSY